MSDPSHLPGAGWGHGPFRVFYAFAVDSFAEVRYEFAAEDR